MSDNKTYYWLKLKEDFFDEDTINWIEEQENGKEYCLFYLKLCLKSLRTNGIMIRTVGETLVPYDSKKLSDITSTDIDTVTVAMNLFVKIGMIQILETGEIYLKQLSELVGSETSKAVLMRRKRALDKASNNVTEMLPDVTNCYPEIEKDKELKKDIKKPKKKTKQHIPKDLQEVRDYVKEHNLDVDPDYFYKFFTEGNWHDSKGNKVMSWKQKILTWSKYPDRNKQEASQLKIASSPY